MFAALKAEFRKLFTVRSTYVIIAGATLLILFITGYARGFKADVKELHDVHYLVMAVINAIDVVAVFGSLIAIFLFSHEYRYNTIMHTLTSVNRRSKVLLAKILVMTSFAGLLALAVSMLAVLATYVGVHLAGHQLAVQSLPVSDLLWRGLFYAWGYAMIGLLLVVLTRNQAFSIVTLFFFPATVEGLLSLILKDNAAYLPFTALNGVLESSSHLSHPQAALVFLGWLLGLWAVAWLLFLRRDATNGGN